MNQEILFLLSFNKRIIAFNTLYSQITGSVKAGLLLSQFMYWWQKTNGEEFYKTKTEMQEETTLSIDEIKGALSKLKKLGFINVKVKGLPPKAHITINVTKLIEAISVKPTNTFLQNPQIDIVETHKYIFAKPTNTIYNTKLPHNTTSKITTYIESKEKNPQIQEVIDYYNQVCNKKVRGDELVISDINKLLNKYTLDEIKLVVDYISTNQWHIEHEQATLTAMMRPTLFFEKLEKAIGRKDKPIINNKPINNVKSMAGANCNTAVVEDDFAVLRRQKEQGILNVDLPKTMWQLLTPEQQDKYLKKGYKPS